VDEFDLLTINQKVVTINQKVVRRSRQMGENYHCLFGRLLSIERRADEKTKGRRRRRDGCPPIRVSRVQRATHLILLLLQSLQLHSQRRKQPEEKRREGRTT
ncbi:hypothetical protein PMAYCL1PPCAC_21920, partial [Pristionchus mayeri]